MKPEPKVTTRREHEAQLHRRMGQQQFELAQRFRGAHLIQVIDDQPQAVLER